MKILSTLLVILFLSTSLIHAQIDNAPDWYMNTPQTEDVLTLTATGYGTSQALVSVLGQVSQSVKMNFKVYKDENESEVSVSESAVKWGNLFIYSKQSNVEPILPNISFEFHSLTCLFPVESGSKFEVCYTEEETDKLLKTNF